MGSTQSTWGFERERERKPKDKTREPIQHPNTMAPAMSVANKNFLGKRVVARQTRAARAAVARRNAKLVVKAGAYDEELIATANSIASQGRGILAMDESNGTCGIRLDSIGVENTEDNRRAYRQLLVTTPGLGEYISGAIMFEETLYQSTKDGKPFVDCLKEANIVPGIKVDKGLVPMANSNKESWCQGLDGLAERCAEYYKQGARFAKWRSVVNITAGPTDKALNDCAYGQLQQGVLVPGSRRTCREVRRVLQAGCPLRQVEICRQHHRWTNRQGPQRLRLWPRQICRYRPGQRTRPNCGARDSS